MIAKKDISVRPAVCLDVRKDGVECDRVAVDVAEYRETHLVTLGRPPPCGRTFRRPRRRALHVRSTVGGGEALALNLDHCWARLLMR